MAHISEYDVENLFIDRLERIGYEFVDMSNYDDVVANFRKQLAAFNAPKLVEAKGEAAFSDAEFGRVMIHVDNHSVYESAKILRDKYVLTPVSYTHLDVYKRQARDGFPGSEGYGFGGRGP